MALGVVDGCRREENKDALIGFIGKRSVYTTEQIENEYFKEEQSSVLAIKFRFMPVLNREIPISELLKEKILLGYPISVVQLEQGQKQNLLNLL